MTKGEHMNERTYVLTYIRTGHTLYPLHNFVVRGDKIYKYLKLAERLEIPVYALTWANLHRTLLRHLFLSAYFHSTALLLYPNIT